MTSTYRKALQKLVTSGDRAFTRRTATASIGLKPMRLAMHHTRQKHSNFTLDQTTAPAPHIAHSNTSCPADDFSSTAHSNTSCPAGDSALQPTAIPAGQTNFSSTADGYTSCPDDLSSTAYSHTSCPADDYSPSYTRGRIFQN